MTKYDFGYSYGYNTRNNFGYNCRVCGLESDALTWGADEKCPSFDICSCCGAEFGLNDDSPDFARLNRHSWGVGQDMEWNWPSARPQNWSWEEQKKQIPPAFRDIEDGGWD